MLANRTPMRWPSAWRDPSALELLKGTAIDSLVMENHSDFAAVRAQARQAGLTIVDPDSPPSGITVVKGLWPGIKMSRSGGADADAGPTRGAWAGSNGGGHPPAAGLVPGPEDRGHRAPK